MPNGKRVNAVAAGGAQTALQARKKTPSFKPKMGQHFLTDRNTAIKIVDALGDVSARTVIEIGPGTGALTDILVQKASQVIAIELDRVLAAQLRMKYQRQTNIEVIEGDVLKMDFASILRGRPLMLTDRAPDTPRATADVLGNIPYYITSDILLRLFSFYSCFETLVLMMQKEVGERLLAKPGTRDYGLLSATAQLYGSLGKVLVLPPGAFAPPPKVHSIVVRMKLAPQFEKLGVEEHPFIDFLKLSFGQKRKILLNNLKSRYPIAPIRAALKQAGIAENVRAEAITISKMAALFRELSAISALNDASEGALADTRRS